MPAEVLYRKWRPQRFADVAGQETVKRTLLNALKNGDKVITTGGIYGTVAGITDNIVQLRIANSVKIDVSRNAIAGLQPQDDQ